MQTESSALESKLEALTALHTETSPDKRRALLHEVTDLFFAPEPPPPKAMALFDHALERLTDALEAELRVELAERLAPATAAPERLVSRLIGDADGAVAEPLLARSAALSAEQLMRVASEGGQMHLRAVSRRSDLTEPLSDKIVERGDDDTLGVLVANAGAPLSRAASEAIVDRAHANPALHAAVVNRESLPLDLLNEMYFTVEQRLRDRIQARNAALPPAAVTEALRHARTRMASRDGALPGDFAAAEAEVDTLLRRGPIAPMVLAAFLRAGEQTRFTLALAKPAGLDFAVVRRVIDRRDAEAFVLVCKAGGIERDLFRTLVMLLKFGEDADGQRQPLMPRFDALPRETAQRVVRFWNVRQTQADRAA